MDVWRFSEVDERRGTRGGTEARSRKEGQREKGTKGQRKSQQTTDNKPQTTNNTQLTTRRRHLILPPCRLRWRFNFRLICMSYSRLESRGGRFRFCGSSCNWR